MEYMITLHEYVTHTTDLPNCALLLSQHKHPMRKYFLSTYLCSPCNGTERRRLSTSRTKEARNLHVGAKTFLSSPRFAGGHVRAEVPVSREDYRYTKRFEAIKPSATGILPSFYFHDRDVVTM